MNPLSPHDLSWCLRRAPSKLLAAVKAHEGKVVVAGGFIRSCIANEEINDIDLFCPSKEYAQAVATSLLVGDRKIIETENAYTVLGHKIPLQFIHRWTYAAPLDVIPSFDFTIARAAFWYQDGKWRSAVDPSFYADLASKRLVYCSPARNEDAGGSLLRVLKFYQRGYRIPLNSMGAVIARLVMGVRMNDWAGDEKHLAKILTGLLREVDPNVDPSHICHLPSLDDDAETEGGAA